MRLDSTLAAALRTPNSPEAVARLFLSLVEPDPAGDLRAPEVRNRVRALLGVPPNHPVKSLGAYGTSDILSAAERAAGLTVVRDATGNLRMRARWKDVLP